MIGVGCVLPGRGKPGWYRTRSNPVSRKGGQRARDNPRKWLNANEMNSEKQDKNEQIKTKVK